MHDILITKTDSFSVITPTTPRGISWCRNNIPALSNGESSAVITNDHREQIEDDAYNANLITKEMT